LGNQGMLGSSLIEAVLKMLGTWQHDHTEVF
jgi:hypothetical protein